MSSFSELSSVIRQHKPSGARSYFFRSSNGRFPHEGAFSLEPFDPPDAPPGSYQLYFCAGPNGGTQLPSLNVGQPPPVITLDGEAGHLMKRGGEAAERTREPREHADPIATHPKHIANRLEFEAIRMADQSLKSKHILDKNMGMHAEVAQAYVLNTYARQEVQRSYDFANQQANNFMNLARIYSVEKVEDAKARAADLIPQRQQETAPILTVLKDIAVILAGSFVPMLTGKQAGKRDPIMDAVIEDEDPEIAKAKKDIADAKKENEALRAGKRDTSKATGNATEEAPKNPEVAAELEALRALKAELLAEREHLRQRSAEHSPRKAAAAEPPKPEEAKTRARRAKPPKKTTKALPPKRSGR